MDIRLGNQSDIENWMRLVDKVREDFPGLETKEALKEHRETVLSFIRRNTAICAVMEEQIVGALLFSKEDNILCFLAVDPQYRRQYIGENMMSYMLTLMDPKKDVFVTTYREEVAAGIPARAFYKRFGFREGKLTEEFGSPVQEFVLKRI